MKGALFTPDNIKAIREGRKTQTRRLFTLEALFGDKPDDWVSRGFVFDWHGWHFTHNRYKSVGRVVKPRYLPGEVVYVKEAWATYLPLENLRPEVVYKVDGLSSGFKWNSPIFMPEKYARTFLLIKDVRPERLQKITPEDAYADNKKLGTRWADNPWVWVYDFGLFGNLS